MAFFRVVAQLEHRAEHRKTASIGRHCAEHRERGFHRVRAGVVAVRIDVIAVLLVDILPHAARFIGLKADRDLLGRLAQQQADRRRRQRVEYIVRARYGELCGEFSAHRQGLRRQTVIYYIKCAIPAAVCHQIAFVVFHAIGDHAAAKLPAFVPQKRLVAAEHRASVRPQPLEDLELCLADALARTEKLDVRGADVGDDRDIRLRRRSHAGDLPEVVHAHLGHHDLGVPRHAEKRQRQADLVIQVALGLPGVKFLL